MANQAELRLDLITVAITIQTHLIENSLVVKNREVTRAKTRTTTIKVGAKKARKIRPRTIKALTKAQTMALTIS